MARDQNQLAGRVQELDEASLQVVTYEQNLKSKYISTATKNMLALKGQCVNKDMENTAKPSVVSHRAWAKDLRASAGDRPPTR